MNPEEKETALIVKLNKLTSTDQIHWEVRNAPPTILRGTDDHIPLFLTTEYKGQQFGIYEQRYRWYDGERDTFYWSNRAILAILDSEDRVLWQTSTPGSALYDLFETARRKVSKIENLLDDLLSGDDTP